jgi:hypothetical protein
VRARLETRGAVPVLMVAASPPQKASEGLRRVRLDYGDRNGVDAVLLRHIEKLQSLGFVEGVVHRLDMREMGVAGWAYVRSVEPCPPLEVAAIRWVSLRFDPPYELGLGK